MKHIIYAFFICCLAGNAAAQRIADFEEFNLPTDQFLNGSDQSGGFESGPVFLPNKYDDMFSFWQGWAISTFTDVATPGFTNQYSAIAGSGYNGSAHYAVHYSSAVRTLQLLPDASPAEVIGMYVTNNTYAYYSIKDGDAFAKKFGGVDGNDPDFFLLTIRGYQNGTLTNDSVDFYLADYRFSDNAEDYIVKDWEWVDLSSLGKVDSLQFSLSSSDVGTFGMNTPAYFCADEITVEEVTATHDIQPALFMTLSPNPAHNYITVTVPNVHNAIGRIYDEYGRLYIQFPIDYSQHRVEIASLPAGVYFLQVQGDNGMTTQAFVKR